MSTPQEFFGDLGRKAALAVNSNNFQEFGHLHAVYRESKRTLWRSEEKQLAINAWQSAYRQHRKVNGKRI